MQLRFLAYLYRREIQSSSDGLGLYFCPYTLHSSPNPLLECWDISLRQLFGDKIWLVGFLCGKCQVRMDLYITKKHGRGSMRQKCLGTCTLEPMAVGDQDKRYRVQTRVSRQSEINRGVEEAHSEDLKIRNENWIARLKALSTQDNNLWAVQKFLNNKRSDIPALNCSTGTAVTDDQKANILADSILTNLTENTIPDDNYDEEDALINYNVNTFLSLPTPTTEYAYPSEIISYIKNSNSKKHQHDNITVAPHLLSRCEMEARFASHMPSYCTIGISCVAAGAEIGKNSKLRYGLDIFSNEKLRGSEGYIQ
ncbi:hypothetical protein TNCV_4309131 [Trichonephila clavipes]|nr:hypothetical protein TNCV_4309131 [Trichonephila clavipes]